jgi:hypothetical protein
MPFDAARSPQDILETALAASGLEHVDLARLEAHKLEQVRCHPAGWLYRHALAVQVSQSWLLLSGIVALGLLGAHELTSWGIAVAAATFLLALAPLLVPTRGPARWRERLTWDFRIVHPAVAERALRLKRQFPDVRFFLGELYQDRVKLDPYLVAEYRGARVVVGIWDGERLIAIA